VSLRIAANPAQHRFAWLWSRGLTALQLSDLGDPRASSGTSYAVCLYDQEAGLARLVTTAVIEAGGLCDGRPCWAALGQSGFVFKNRSRNSDGIAQLRLKSGAAGRSSVKIKAQGAALPLPASVSSARTFRQDPAVIVQLHSRNPDACWSSTFTTASRNDGVQFKGTVR
jgi:hypothetical protein